MLLNFEKMGVLNFVREVTHRTFRCNKPYDDDIYSEQITMRLNPLVAVPFCKEVNVISMPCKAAFLNTV